ADIAPGIEQKVAVEVVAVRLGEAGPGIDPTQDLLHGVRLPIRLWVHDTPPTLTLPLEGGGEMHGMATKSPSPSKGEGGVGVTLAFLKAGTNFLRSRRPPPRCRRSCR